jgi:uncharacterized cupredoxin-like copper-binding protein
MINKFNLALVFGLLAIMALDQKAESAGQPAAVTKVENVDWSTAKLVTLIAADYHFMPDHLVFQHGVPYRLHVENQGTQIHDLTAPDFFAAIEIRNPEFLTRSGTQLSIQPSDRKDIYFIARQSGSYGMVCADHDWAGMTMNIEVK